MPSKLDSLSQFKQPQNRADLRHTPLDGSLYLSDGRQRPRCPTSHDQIATMCLPAAASYSRDGFWAVAVAASATSQPTQYQPCARLDPKDGGERTEDLLGH